MTPASLAVIGHIEIPAAALEHRFAHEALANAMLLTRKADAAMQVVGTENTRACELYGWAPNVDSHRDCTGWVYLVALNDGFSTVQAWASAKPGARKVHSIKLQRGDIVRLWDFCEHWTEDRAPRIAAFVGSFERPRDREAVALLQRGVDSLAAGDYYGAPRVRAGFRALLDDECLAATDDFSGLEPMLLADARRQKRLIERCARCGKPAVRPDDKWPYFSEKSVCRAHLGSAREQANATVEAL
ncbi:hypothetical protein [Variovorax sp. V15]|uniref:hypothetical protein n=1 Tax=Variovorax sp. V15 TaxID=3065952 RepID=UPI0034E8F5AC